MKGEAKFTIMSDIKRWTIFALLSPEFISKIKRAIVFGTNGTEAIILTEDDQVYGLGTNHHSCLGFFNGIGIGNGFNTLDPIRIESLCGRSIISLAFGSGPHVLAITENGDVYSWGHNSSCQLGNGTNNLGTCPSPVSGYLLQCKIVEVACGSHHSVAVSDSGDLIAWGHNSCGQLGLGHNNNQPLPKKVAGAIANKFVKHVACTQGSTVALVDDGEVYTWGQNGNGQLGIGSLTNHTSPCRVLELHDVQISQVVCGFAHVLALSTHGDVFAWGSNSCGQLGQTTRVTSGSSPHLNGTNVVVPVRTVADLGRIQSMAAVHACNISAAMTQDHRVFMWGLIRGQCISQPQLTGFQLLDDIFACFASPSVSWRMISFAKPSPHSIQEGLRRAFDDPTTADVRLMVEGRAIHAHRAVLKIRCEHFRSMLQEGAWSEADKEFIEIPQFNYAVYRAFIKYLYTDQLDVSTEEAVGLLDLANSYCEQELKERCAEFIRRGVSVDNAVMMYAAAGRYGARDLEDYCFRFCLNHMTAITQSEAFQRLDEHTIKHFITEAARHGAFKH